MRSCAAVFFGLIVASSVAWALSPEEQQQYEMAMVQAVGGIEVHVMDDGSKLYRSLKSVHAYMKDWDGVVAAPPALARGTRLLKAWDTDIQATDMGFDEAYSAKYRAGDGNDYEVTIIAMRDVDGAWLFFTWSTPDGSEKAPAPDEPPAPANPLKTTQVQEQRTTVNDGQAFSLGVSPDSRTIAVGTSNGRIVLLDALTGTTRITWQAYVPQAESEALAGVASVGYLPSSQTLVSASLGGDITVWESPAKVRSTYSLMGDKPMVAQYALRPDGKTLAAAGWRLTHGCGEINLETGLQVRKYCEKAAAVAFDATGRRIAYVDFAGEPERLVVFEVVTGDKLCDWAMPDSQPGASRIRFSPDGKLITAMLDDGVLATFDLEANKPLYVYRSGVPRFRDIVYTPDGRLLLVSLEGAGLNGLDPRSGQARSGFGTGCEFWPLAVSAEGDFITCGYSVLRAAAGNLCEQLRAAVGATGSRPAPVARAPQGAARAATDAAAVPPRDVPHGIEVEGSTLVPLRYIAEWLGATVVFDAPTGRLTMQTATTELGLTLGSRQARIGERSCTLDVPAMTRKGTTYVPVRFVAEGFDATVKWDQAKRQAHITHPISGAVLAIPVSAPSVSAATPRRAATAAAPARRVVVADAIKIVSNGDAYLYGRMKVNVNGMTLLSTGRRHLFGGRDPNVTPDGTCVVIFEEMDYNLYPDAKAQGLKVGRAYLEVSPGQFEPLVNVELRLSDGTPMGKF